MLRTDIISLPNNCALFTAHRKLFKNIFEADIELWLENDHLFSSEISFFLPNRILEIFLKSKYIRKPGFYDEYHNFFFIIFLPLVMREQCSHFILISPSYVHLNINFFKNCEPKPWKFIFLLFCFDKNIISFNVNEDQ